MKIEINLPDIEGFIFIGEFRIPKQNEWCLVNGMPMRRIHMALTDGDFVLEDTKGDNVTLNYVSEFPILEKLPKEKTLEERIKEKWPDKRIVMLNWDDDIDTGERCLFIGSTTKYHIVAQSMNGYDDYVYQLKDGGLVSVNSVTMSEYGEILHPVAVLFEVKK